MIVEAEIRHARDLDDETVLELILACNEGRCKGGEGFHGGAPGYGHKPGKPTEPHWQNRWDLGRALGDPPEKVVRAKIRRLINRGLITGCACGCRGDLEIK